MTTSLGLPTADIELNLEPGGIKKVKTDNRRSDAMSFVDPAKLKVMPGFNVRVRDEQYLAHIRQLANSMLEPTGFLIEKPISCYVNKEPDGTDSICILDGHSRHEAAMLAISEGAAFDAVPVVFVSKTLSMADMTVGLIRSNSGRQLTTYEKAIVVKRLANMGLEDGEIAKRLSYTPTYVESLMLLSAALPVLAQLVASDKVSATVAIEAIRKHGQVKAAEVLSKAVQSAAGEGKARVTAAALPGAAYNKAVKKCAPLLADGMRQVTRDPGFAALSADTRAMIESLLKPLAEHQPAA
ncbi:MAG: hypothetical protein A2580_17970 [Hydrogenophilales bacterium RIFOXYD1_FULL_62_11]|nr:MAG: hypothetical protein A2580_17970 [Hydrogenophilales bacterium RIFOXYD1_FULL_62_11]